MRVDGIAPMVRVSNLDAAVRFYRDTLGLNLVAEQEGWAWFGEGLGLMTIEDITEVGVGVNSVMINVLVSDVESAYRELTARGVAFLLAPEDVGGAKSAVLRDPEGNLIQLLDSPLLN